MARNPGCPKAKAWRVKNKTWLHEYMRKWRAENKEHMTQYDQAYRKKWRAANPERLLYQSAKMRAKRNGLTFKLSMSDIVIPLRCPVFGKRLKRGIGQWGPWSPTLDRIDNRKGYVRGNVAVISARANNLKGDATAAEHRRIAEWMDTK
jgi:hypothetical protein